MNKNMFLIFIILLMIAPSVAFADCSDCTYGNCKACGCIESKSESDGKCVYDNISSNLEYKSCGDKMLTNIPSTIPKLTHIAYNAIQVVIPVLLVLFCSIDLLKAVMAGKEDEIKKNQSIVIKRLVAAVLVYFLFVIVKFVISASADNGSKIIKCAECFISEVCK